MYYLKKNKTKQGVKIMNETLKALYGGEYNLNAIQIRIILYILDNTKNDEKGVFLTLKDLSFFINASGYYVERDIKKLLDKNILKTDLKHTTQDMMVLTINSSEEWKNK